MATIGYVKAGKRRWGPESLIPLDQITGAFDRAKTNLTRGNNLDSCIEMVFFAVAFSQRSEFWIGSTVVSLLQME